MGFMLHTTYHSNSIHVSTLGVSAVDSLLSFVHSLILVPSVVVIKKDWNNPLQRWWNVCSYEPKHDYTGSCHCGRRAAIYSGLKPSTSHNNKDLPSRSMLTWGHITICNKLGLGETYWSAHFHIRDWMITKPPGAKDRMTPCWRVSNFLFHVLMF